MFTEISCAMYSLCDYNYHPEIYANALTKSGYTLAFNLSL